MNERFFLKMNTFINFFEHSWIPTELSDVNVVKL